MSITKPDKVESDPIRRPKSRLKENGLLFILRAGKYMPKPIPTKKIPPLTIEQMEEIFMDRLANLIVRLLDYRQMEKDKAKQNEYEKPAGQQ